MRSVYEFKGVRWLLAALFFTLLIMPARGADPMSPRRKQLDSQKMRGFYVAEMRGGVDYAVRRVYEQDGLLVFKLLDQRTEGFWRHLVMFTDNNTMRRFERDGEVWFATTKVPGYEFRLEQAPWESKVRGDFLAAWQAGTADGLYDFLRGSELGWIKVRLVVHMPMGEEYIRAGLRGVRFRETENMLSLFSRLDGELFLEDLPKLARQDWVETITWPELPIEPENENSAALIGVRKLQSVAGLGKGLTGKGVNVGVFDEVVEQHTDFGTRLHIQDTGPRGTSHGLHVTGTIGGAGKLSSSAKGMAPEASLYTYNAFAGSVVSKFIDAYKEHDVRISSNSYGINLDKVCSDYERYTYPYKDADIDYVLRSLPELSANYSAGNYQDGCNSYRGGYMSSTRTTKNAMVVGAVDAAGNMTDFSSWGPLVDGRMVPLIVTDGSNIISTTYDNGYTNMSGTSMAQPAMTGLTTLLYEQFKAENGGKNPHFIVIKNALLNTSSDLGRKGPDYQYGYGLANGVRASSLLSEKRYDLLQIGKGDAKSVKSITVPQGVKRLRVMIVWHDVESVGSEKHLVNDLDLELHGNGRVYMPWVLDPRNYTAPASTGHDRLNNHEQVEIENPAAGQYQVWVTAYDVPGEAVEYSLTWDFDYEDSPIQLDYPYGGERINASTGGVRVHWSNAMLGVPVEVHVSYDDGQTWAKAAQEAAEKGVATVFFPKDLRFAPKTRVRLVQDGKFVEGASSFSIIPMLTIESIHTPCAEQPTIAWEDLGAGVTYEVSYIDKKTGEVSILESTLTSAKYTLSDYDESKMVTARVKKDGIYGDYALPVLPTATRPLVVTLDDRATKPIALNKLGTINTWFALGSKTRTINAGGGMMLLLGYNDVKEWKEPSAGGDDVFDKNPAHTSSVQMCLDLTRVSKSQAYRIAGLVQTFPKEGMDSWVRYVVTDEDGQSNPQVMPNTKGITVRNGKTTDRSALYDCVTDLSEFAGKKVVLRSDMAVKGPGNKQMNDAVVMFNAQLFVADAKDVAMRELKVPQSSVTLGAEKLSVVLMNSSISDLTDELATVRIYNGKSKTPMSEQQVLLSIGARKSATIDLPNTVDLSQPMTHYDLRAEVVLDGDMNANNNSASASVTNLKGYLLMNNLSQFPVKGQEEMIAIASGSRIFTDNMGPYEDLMLKSVVSFFGRETDVPTLGAFQLKADIAGKFVQLAMQEVDLGTNELDVYLVDRSGFGQVETLLYRFSGKYGSGVVLSTQKPGQTLLVKYITKDDKIPVRGWVAEVKLVDAPTVNVSNDMLTMTSLNISGGVHREEKDIAFDYINLSNKEQEDVDAGVARVGWGGSSSIIIEEELKVGITSDPQHYEFTVPYVVEDILEEEKVVALMGSRDPIFENNMQRTRIYVGDYTPETSVTVGNDDEYTDAQIVGVGINGVIFSTDKENKFATARMYPRNYRSKSFTAGVGSQLPLVVKVGGTYSDASVGVWVDWDGNHTFEASDLVGTQTGRYDNTSKSLNLQLDINVPADASFGKKLMRIVVVKGTNAPQIGKNDMEGEVEDYTLEVVDPNAASSSVDLSIRALEVVADGKTLRVDLGNVGAAGTITNPTLTVSIDGEAGQDYSQTVALNVDESQVVDIVLERAQADRLAQVGLHTVKVSHAYAGDVKAENNSRVVSYEVAPMGRQGSYVLAFDGQSTVATLDDFGEIDLQGVTYEGWVRVDQFSLQGDVPGLGKFFDASLASLYFCGLNSTLFPSNSHVLYVNDAVIYHTEENSVQPGVWTHVAVTIDRSVAEPVAKLYINGQEKKLIATPNTAAKAAAKTLCLANRSTGDRPLIGALDEFRVWSVVRTPQEIADNMQKRVNGTAGLVAEFTFTDIAGSSVTKSSDGQHALTLKGVDLAAVWQPEPTPEVVTFGVAGAKERKESGEKWRIELPAGGDPSAVTLSPLFSMLNTTPTHNGSALSYPIDLSADYEVLLTSSWMGEPKESAISVRAFARATVKPELKNLTLANQPVTVASDMVITLPSGTDLSAVLAEFSVEPADAVVKIAGKAVASGALVDLRSAVILVVTDASGFSSTEYTLTADSDASVVWTAGTLGYTYGQTSIPAFEATAGAGYSVAYEVEDKNILTVSGVQPIVHGVGKTNVTAVAVQSGRKMLGGVTREVTVAPAPLTVTAENVTVEFSDPLPTEYTFTYSGFVLSEDEQVLDELPKAVCTGLPGTGVSPEPGKYTIEVSGGRGANYTLSYVNGVLEVKDVPSSLVTLQLEAPAGMTLSLENREVFFAGRTLVTDANGKAILKIKNGKYGWSFSGANLGVEDEASEVELSGDITIPIQLRKLAQRYTLSIAIEGDGEVDSKVDPFTVEVREGDPAPLLVASPAMGYRFSHWTTNPDGLVSGANASNATLTTDVVTKDYAITAHFAKEFYTVTYAVEGDGEIQPAGLASQTLEFLATTSQVAAVAHAGSVFTGWDDGKKTVDRVDVVRGRITYTAKFAKVLPLPFTEGFEDDSPTRDLWQNTGAAGMKWKFAAQSSGYQKLALSSGLAATFDVYRDGAGYSSPSQVYLATPLLGVQNMSSVTVTFVYRNISGADNFRLEYSTDAGVTWANLRTFSTKEQHANKQERIELDPSVITAASTLMLRWVFEGTGSNVFIFDDVNVTGVVLAGNYTVSYSVRSGDEDKAYLEVDGDMQGTSFSQDVAVNADGPSVRVVVKEPQRYEFKQWSDGSIENPRVDQAVKSPVDVVAEIGMRCEVPLELGAGDLYEEKFDIMPSCWEVSAPSFGAEWKVSGSSIYVDGQKIGYGSMATSTLTSQRYDLSRLDKAVVSFDYSLYEFAIFGSKASLRFSYSSDGGLSWKDLGYDGGVEVREGEYAKEIAKEDLTSNMRFKWEVITPAYMLAPFSMSAFRISDVNYHTLACSAVPLDLVQLDGNREQTVKHGEDAATVTAKVEAPGKHFLGWYEEKDNSLSLVTEEASLTVPAISRRSKYKAFAANVEFKVVDAQSKQALRNAQVVLYVLDGYVTPPEEKVEATLTSNANGEAYDYWYDGEYLRLEVKCGGYLPYKKEKFTVKAVGVTELLVELMPDGTVTPPMTASLAFEVTDVNGAVSGATVRVRDASGVDKTSLTGSDGRASFARLALGDYSYEVTHADYEAKHGTAKLETGGSTVDVSVMLTKKQAQPGTMAMLAFEVTDVNGAVSGATVRVRDASGADKSALTGSDGRASFARLALGDYSYEVTHADYETKSDRVTLDVDGSTVEVKLEKKVKQEEGDKTPVEQEALRRVTLRPNPASTVLYVDNAAEVKRLSVVSMVGITLLQYDNSLGEAIVRIALEGFAEGVYLLVVEGDGGRRVIPFAVKF